MTSRDASRISRATALAYRVHRMSDNHQLHHLRRREQETRLPARRRRPRRLRPCRTPRGGGRLAFTDVGEHVVVRLPLRELAPSRPARSYWCSPSDRRSRPWRPAAHPHRSTAAGPAGQLHQLSDQLLVERIVQQTGSPSKSHSNVPLSVITGVSLRLRSCTISLADPSRVAHPHHGSRSGRPQKREIGVE